MPERRPSHPSYRHACALVLAANAIACTEPDIAPPPIDGELMATPVSFTRDSEVQRIAPTTFAGLTWVPSGVAPNTLVVVDRAFDAYQLTFDDKGAARARAMGWTDVANVRGITFAPRFPGLVICRWTGCMQTDGNGCVTVGSPTGETATEQVIVPFGPLAFGALHPLDVEVRGDGMYILDPLYVDPAPPRPADGAILAVLGPAQVDTRGTTGTIGTQGLGLGPGGDPMDPNDQRPFRYVTKSGPSPTVQSYPSTAAAAPRVLAYVPEPEPQGLAVDSENQIFMATGNGVTILDGATGERRGSITLPTGDGKTAAALNVAFGGADYKTLFITSPAGLFSVKVATAGLP